jgi:TP901 family phage tail tape measure protein
MPEDTLTIRVLAETDEAKKGLEDVAKTTKKSGEDATASAIQWAAFGAGLKVVGDKAAGATNSAVSSFVAFDSAMADASSQVQGTTSDLEGLRKQALALSQEAPASAASIADGYTVLAKEGYSANEIMKMTPYLLKESVVQGKDFASMASLAANMMDAYGVSAEDSNGMLDLLRNGALQAGASIDEFGSAMMTIGPTATAMGISMSDTTAVLALLKQQGMESSAAAGGLKLMLMNMASPSKAAAEQMAALGIEIVKNKDGSINMTATLQSLQAALAGTSSETDRMAILQTLFGDRTATVAGLLVKNTDNLNGISEALKEGGTNTEAFEKKTSSASAQLEIAKNKSEAAKIAMGESLAPAQIFLADATAKVVGAFAALPAPLRDTLGVGTLLFGQITQMLAPLAMMAPLLKAINLERTKEALISAGVTIKNGFLAASQWLVNTSMYGCPIVWIIGAIILLIAIIAALILNWDKVSKAVGDFGAWCQKGLADAGGAINKWAGDTQKRLGEVWSGLKEGMANAAGNMNSWWADQTEAAKKAAELMRKAQEEAWNKVKDFLKGVWDTISDGFTGLWNKAIEWGSKLIKSFQEGMEKAKKGLQDTLGDIGDKVQDFLGIHSPAKEGPLSHLEEWPRNLVDTYAKGMMDRSSAVERASSSVASSINRGGSSYDQRNYNLSGNVTVIAQPLDLNDPFIRRELTQVIAQELKRMISTT